MAVWGVPVAHEDDALRDEVRAPYTEIGARARLAQLDTPATASSAAVAPSAAGSTSR